MFSLMYIVSNTSPGIRASSGGGGGMFQLFSFKEQCFGQGRSSCIWDCHLLGDYSFLVQLAIVRIGVR